MIQLHLKIKTGQKGESLEKSEQKLQDLKIRHSFWDKSTIPVSNCLRRDLCEVSFCYIQHPKIHFELLLKALDTLNFSYSIVDAVAQWAYFQMLP